MPDKFDEILKEAISVNRLAEIFALDRRTVKKYLEEQAVKEIGKGYHYGEAQRALVHAKKGQASADRRNEAQAEKAEVETLILRKKHLPVESFLKLMRPRLAAVAKHIENSDMEDDYKGELVKIITAEFDFDE